jgi:hypothetical protein
LSEKAAQSLADYCVKFTVEESGSRRERALKSFPGLVHFSDMHILNSRQGDGTVSVEISERDRAWPKIWAILEQLQTAAYTEEYAFT